MNPFDVKYIKAVFKATHKRLFFHGLTLISLACYIILEMFLSFSLTQST